MGYSSFPKSPKKEEEQQEVPNSNSIWDHFKAFFELTDEQKPPLPLHSAVYGAPLDWDLMDHHFDGEEAFGRVVPQAYSSDGDDVVMSNMKKKVSLNLNLNYEEVLEAWSGRGSLWAAAAAAAGSSVSNPTYADYMGEVPRMEEERTRRVLRYKEKRHTRLFSNKIRYQVRKLNAEKRPRIKGRFVKTVS